MQRRIKEFKYIEIHLPKYMFKILMFYYAYFLSKALNNKIYGRI